MNEDQPIEQTTQTPETPEIAKETPKVDPNAPANIQVDQLLKAFPADGEEPKKEEPVKEDESIEEPEEIEEDEPEEVQLEALPEWQKYVLDNLPQIQTLGHTKDGKDKVFNVKRLEDLPDDFEFASKRAELAFNAALASQEVNARELLNKYKAEEQQRSYKEFQAQEAIDIQNDIVALQKEGVLPKFKYKENDSRFNDDPAVKEANEIYDLYTKTNEEYFKKYANSGRTYRISYRDAADKFYAHKARTTPKDDPVKKERQDVAAKVSAPQSASPESRRPVVTRSMEMRDIYKLYKMGKI